MQRRRPDCDYLVARVLPFKRSTAADGYDRKSNYTHDDAKRGDWVGLPLCMNHNNGVVNMNTGVRKPNRRIGTVLSASEYATHTYMVGELDRQMGPPAKHSSDKVGMNLYSDVSLGNADIMTDDAAQKMEVEVSLVKRGRRPGSSIVEFLPSRASLEHWWQHDRQTLVDMATKYNYEQPPAADADAQQIADYMSRVDAVTDQRFAALWTKFAEPPADVRSRKPPVEILNEMSAAALTEASDAAAAPPERVDTSTDEQMADATSDKMDTSTETPVPDKNNPLVWMKMLEQQKKENLELRQQRQRESEEARVAREKADKYDELKRKEAEYDVRLFKSVSAAFEDEAKKKKYPGNFVEKTREQGEHLSKSNPKLGAELLQNAIVLMTEASANQERAEKAEYEARMAKQRMNFADSFEAIEKSINNIDRQRLLISTEQPAKKKAMYEFPAKTDAEIEKPAAPASTAAAAPQQPLPSADVRSAVAAAAAPANMAAAAAANRKKMNPFSSGGKITFMACSEEDWADAPDAAHEYALLSRHLGRPPTDKELALGITEVHIGFETNSITGERVERKEVRRARQDPYMMSIFNFDRAAAQRILRQQERLTASNAPAVRMECVEQPVMQEIGLL